MKLMYEIETPEVCIEEQINETTGVTEKKYKIKGVFSTIGEKNRNGRVYPRHLWEQNVLDYQEILKSGSINRLCEWQHPARQNVDPMAAVAVIDKLEIKDKYVMGEATLLNNPQANQLKSLIDNGVKLSVSSRGVGSVKNGVVEDFKLITYDIVDTPSDYNATMNGMVESYQLNEGVIEGKNFEIRDGEIVETKLEPELDIEQYKKAVKSRFNSFLSNVSGLNESKSDLENYKTLLNNILKDLDKIHTKFDSSKDKKVLEINNEVGLFIGKIQSKLKS